VLKQKGKNGKYLKLNPRSCVLDFGLKLNGKKSEICPISKMLSKYFSMLRNFVSVAENFLRDFLNPQDIR